MQFSIFFFLYFFLSSLSNWKSKPNENAKIMKCFVCSSCNYAEVFLFCHISCCCHFAIFPRWWGLTRTSACISKWFAKVKRENSTKFEFSVGKFNFYCCRCCCVISFSIFLFTWFLLRENRLQTEASDSRILWQSARLHRCASSDLQSLLNDFLPFICSTCSRFSIELLHWAAFHSFFPFPFVMAENSSTN